jgi:hypothetical protein
VGKSPHQFAGELELLVVKQGFRLIHGLFWV